MNQTDLKTLIETEFSALGFHVIYWNEKPNSNGPDCWVQKNKQRPLSVEIKTVKKKANKAYQVDPVSKPRMGDDIVAIVLNTEYVLIQPLREHLALCSKGGTRNLTILCKGGE